MTPLEESVSLQVIPFLSLCTITVTGYHHIFNIILENDMQESRPQYYSSIIKDFSIQGIWWRDVVEGYFYGIETINHCCCTLEYMKKQHTKDYINPWIIQNMQFSNETPNST